MAARAGHYVDVLLKIYAKCVDGQEQEMNDRILKGLREEDDAVPDHPEEWNGDGAPSSGALS